MMCSIISFAVSEILFLVNLIKWCLLSSLNDPLLVHITEFSMPLISVEFIEYSCNVLMYHNTIRQLQHRSNILKNATFLY